MFKIQQKIGDVTTEEILNAMKSFKNNKATGNDEIPIEYLKSVGEDTKAKNSTSDQEHIQRR